MFSYKAQKKNRRKSAVLFIFTKRRLVCYVRKESYLSCSLYSGVDIALMLCTSTGNSSGEDLASLRNELAKTLYVLVIDVIYLLCAENANFLSLAVLAEVTCVIR